MRKYALVMAAATLVIAVPTFAQAINDPASVPTTTAPPAVSNPNDTAKLSGKPVDVAVDYQGNVTQGNVTQGNVTAH